MTDADIMPFGKFKGVAMEKVPADYLLWLWDSGVHTQSERDIHRYIRESFSALETEASDYIVQHRPRNGT